jgi:hypothetical protein
VAGRVLKRVKSVVKGFRVGAKFKPNANSDDVSGRKLSSADGAISGRGSGQGCLQRPMEFHGSALWPDVTSAADPGVDMVLSLSGARSSDRVLVPVVESVNEGAVPSSLPALMLRPPVFLSVIPFGVRPSLVSSSSESGLILR